METEAEYGLPSIGIPAELLFNPELTNAEKILFGFIRNLSKTERGCWSSNRYLGELVGAGKQTVSNGISNLKRHGYIKIKIVEKDPLTKEEERRIYEDLDYQGRYRKLVELSHEVYIKHNIGVKEILYTYIKKFIRKEASEKSSEGDSSSSLRKEDEEGNPEISHQTSDSVNPSTRPSLETTNEEAPAKSSRPARDDSILPRKKVPAKQLEYEHASDEARSLVEDWNGLPTTPVHKNGSQAVRKVLHLLDKKLLKEHGSKGIFMAMLDFSNMQRNAGDYRVPTGKVSIDDFFIGNGYLNGARERRGETVEPTWFQKLILPGSFVKYLRRADPNPEVTEELRYRYRKHVLADQGVSFGPRQESQFREASKRLTEFMGRGRLEKFLDNVGYKDYVRFLLDALIGKYKKVTEIEVGHLCSNYTWNDLFPKFIAYNWEE